MGTRISDAIVAASIGGTEKIPVSGASTPAITPDLLKTFFGTWTSWTPTFTGFSDIPSSVTARYCKIGKIVIIEVRMAGTGTSNSSLFRITNPPFAGATTHLQGTVFWNGMDAGVALTVPGRVYIKMSPDFEIVIERDISGTGWTASGNKRVDFTLVYEAV